MYEAQLDMKLILEVDECLVNRALRRTGKARMAGVIEYYIV